MNTVQGKNIMAFLKVSGTYYPVFCGKTLNYEREQEVLETTSVNSGADRDFESAMSTARLEISGVTILDNTGLRISGNYLEQAAVRRQKLDWKITQTDDDGDIFVRTFQGIITRNSFDKTIPGYSQSTVSVLVCGPVTMATVEDPATDEIVYSDWWTFTAGATSIGGNSDVHGYNLEGVTVLEVDREGTQHDIITSGTPSNRKCKHNNGTGTISFDSDNPSNGETVFVLFKRVL